MITWDIAYRLLFDRGLGFYGENIAYEDNELRELAIHHHELEEEMVKIQDRVTDKFREKLHSNFKGNLTT